MATTYKTPGVYIEEIPKFPPSVAQVETAIPAFIGYTQTAQVRGVDYHKLMDQAKAKAEKKQGVEDEKNDAKAKEELQKAYEALPDGDPNPVAIRITSFLEYEQFFGKAEDEKGIKASINANEEAIVTIETPSKHNMYYSLQAFFANGGGPCYIVSVGKTTASVVTGAKVTASGDVNLAILKKGLTAIEKEDEITLIVCPESLALSLDDAGAFYIEALKQCKKLQDRFVVMDAKLDTSNTTVRDQAASFRNVIGTENLIYGAAYGPCIETIFDYQYEDEDVTVDLTNAPPPPDNSSAADSGSSAADGGSPATEGDGSPATEGDGSPATEDDGSPATGNSKKLPEKLSEIDPKKSPAAYGQYYPLVKSAIGAEPVVLPAAPLVVGVYAAVDNDRGVWKAPANVSLSSVVGPTIKISSDEQDNLNVHTTGKSINAIRSFTGKGTLIWGARTLAGNDNEWRYVPVRRFFNMAEESIKKATEGFVFEPNDSNTWTKIKAMIENFLTLQWRAGALQGAKPEQSFYVKVGLNETMTALDILEGRLIIEIGMAVVRPAEFIILKFSHKMAES